MSAKDVIFPDAAPFAQRSDGMSMDTLRSGDTLKGCPKIPRESSFLHIDDIMTKKRQLVHPNKDMVTPISYQKSWYRPIGHGLKKPRDLSLMPMMDQRNQGSMIELDRHVDPVCPQYIFPGHRTLKAVEPHVPYGHDSGFVLKNRDIEGSTSKTMINNSVPPHRRHLDSSDIEYSTPYYRTRVVARQKYSGSRNCFYQEPSKPIRDYRHTNPLDPNYTVSVAPGSHLNVTWNEEENLPKLKSEPISLGPVPGSRPRKLQWSNSEPQLGLMTQDIAGANPLRWIGELSFNIYNPRTSKSKPIMNTNIHDIPGAQVGTLRQGLANTRDTNPLLPQYTLLDGSKSVI